MNKAHKTDEPKITLAMIATYPEMYRILSEITEEEGITLYNRFASFDDAAMAAKKLQPTVDAILTRGGTGEYVRRAVRIPVISIPISPFDLSRSVYRLKEEMPDVKEVAFFNFSRNIYGVRDIEEMFGVTIHEYTFIDKPDIEQGVEDVERKGIKVLIGGDLAARLAMERGLEGYEIIPDKEAIYNAVHQAIQLVKVRREKEARSTRLKIAFNSITEGIVVADENKKISICNPAAESIFHLDSNSAIGKNIETLLPCKKLSQVYTSGKPERNYLQKVYGGMINTNHLPIHLEGNFIGVVSTFEDITKIQNLEQQIRKSLNTKGFVAKYSFGDILTRDNHMDSLKRLASLYATTDSAILIEGESGTGKELFAQSIHNASPVAFGPFVAVNCAAIPEQLLESELFGYDSGAFTGAKKEGNPGLFELAHNGTIFLDEIGELPKSLQARLLRVIQEKEIMRVGGRKIVPVNIRIISATNQDVRKKVEQGDFREDLYYRLNVFNIKIPPLRERKQDIELLFMSILKNLQIEINGHVKNIMQKQLPLLQSYDWPGNVRELHNMVEKFSLIFKTPDGEKYFPEILQEIQNNRRQEPLDDDYINLQVYVGNGLKEAVTQVEKNIIEEMMVAHHNDLDVILKKLGIGRTTLWRKVKEGHLDAQET